MFCLLQNSLILISDTMDRCTGGSFYQIGSCCTENNPCEVNQGDCDVDDQCKDDLVCGKNNCGSNFAWKGADCCEVKSGKQIITIIDLHKLIFLKIVLLFVYICLLLFLFHLAQCTVNGAPGDGLEQGTCEPGWLCYSDGGCYPGTYIYHTKGQKP